MDGVDRDAADGDPDDGYRLAVAVGNSGNVEQLMRTAVDVARDNDGGIVVVSVIAKPAESPFSLFADDVIRREFAGDRRTVLDRALAAAEDSGVPVDGRLLVARSVARGIADAVAEYGCDAVLLGWRERRRSDAVFGHNVDRLVRRAPADVLVEKIGPTANGVEAVLLPAGEGPNTDLAAAVARAVALANDARVDVLRVIDPGAVRRERAAVDLLEAVLEALGPVEAETEVRKAGDAAEAVIEAARTRDVTVMGMTERRWLPTLVGTTSERVARDARSTVILTKRAGRVRSLLGRLL